MCVHLEQEQGAQDPCPETKPIPKVSDDVLMHRIQVGGGTSCDHWHWADVALPDSRVDDTRFDVG